MNTADRESLVNVAHTLAVSGWMQGPGLSAAIGRVLAYPVTMMEHDTPKTPATDPGAVVLRDFGPDASGPRYVTHWRNDANPERPSYSSGGYFDDLADAAEDFARRVRRNY